MSARTLGLSAALAVLAWAGAARGQDYSGAATYSNINGGVCSGDTKGLPAVSMNAAQFGGGSACGQCVQIQGTGNGAGSTPVSTTSYIAIVNSVCPQCAYGDIDLQSAGSGKFGITWSFVPCPGGGRKLIELPSASEDAQAAAPQQAAAPAEDSSEPAALEQAPADAVADAEVAEPAEPTAAAAERPLTSRRLLRA